MGIKGDVIAVGVVGVVLLAAAWYAKKKIPNIDPTDDNNVFNRGANSIYRAITGDDVGTIGTGIYDVTHNGTFNPTSSNNLAYRTNAWFVQTVTGDDDATLGTKIYDWLH